MNRTVNRLTRFFGIGVLAAILGTTGAPNLKAATPANSGNVGAQAQGESAQYEAWLSNQVRHQLVMLPYYSVFDNLAYRVDGNAVILEGQVARSTLRPDAESAVKHIEGVGNVVNNIEVLPLSPMDDHIRIQEYRAIYGFAPLQRYGVGTLHTIHIIVKNGNVTLIGAVDNEADKNAANIRANGVPGVFSVTNDLTVEKS
ncbi:MAG: BON domain-containing protein [Candidatus Acidiferrales bacterium]